MENTVAYKRIMDNFDANMGKILEFRKRSKELIALMLEEEKRLEEIRSEMMLIEDQDMNEDEKNELMDDLENEKDDIEESYYDNENKIVYIEKQLIYEIAELLERYEEELEGID